MYLSFCDQPNQTKKWVLSMSACCNHSALPQSCDSHAVMAVKMQI